MNNTQLYLAIGLPLFVNLSTMMAVAVSALLFRAQVNSICAKIDRICAKDNPERAILWDNVHQRMAKLESRD